MNKVIEINCPVNSVFDYLADGNNSNSYLADGFKLIPIGVTHFALGTRVNSVGSFLGFTFKQLFEVVTFGYGKLVRLRSIDKGQFESEVTWRLEPLDEERCRVALELKIVPANSFLGLLIAPVVPQIEQRVVIFVEQTLRRLKKVVEAKAAVSAA